MNFRAGCSQTLDNVHSPGVRCSQRKVHKMFKGNVHMAQGKKTAKNKRSFDEKSAIVMNAINADMRRTAALYKDSKVMKYGKQYTMGQLAQMSGYSRSSRFMLFLYEMVDRGYLAKSEWNGHEICGRGICDVNIYFMLPEFAIGKLTKSMFTDRDAISG